MSHTISESPAAAQARLERTLEAMQPEQVTIMPRRGLSPAVLSGLALLLASVVLISGCASTGGGTSVVDRAEKRWQALLAGDFQTAYSYYSPGFRSSRTLGDFELSQRLRKVQFRDAEYLEHECEAESCTLKFNVKYHISSPVPGVDTWESKTVLDEKWVRTQGQWWYLPKD